MRLRPAVILVVTGQPPDTEGLLKLLPSFVALPRELRGERVSKSRKRGWIFSLRCLPPHSQCLPVPVKSLL